MPGTSPSGQRRYQLRARRRHRLPGHLAPTPQRLARAKVKAAAAHTARLPCDVPHRRPPASSGRFDVSTWAPSADRQRSLRHLGARQPPRAPAASRSRNWRPQYLQLRAVSDDRAAHAAASPWASRTVAATATTRTGWATTTPDINLQMNYWMADRTGLSQCFDALTDYCLAQLPAWSDLTRRLFGDPRNRYRNSSRKDRGLDRRHLHQPPRRQRLVVASGGQRLAVQHLSSTTSSPLARTHLEAHLPTAEGRLRVLGEARLITTTEPGGTKEVLVADSDWSPEHGLLMAKGITYAQELIGHCSATTRCAAAELDRGPRASPPGSTALRGAAVLFSGVSSRTGWLQEVRCHRTTSARPPAPSPVAAGGPLPGRPHPPRRLHP